MIPALRATYRLQFHRGFTFADAQALVPYLAELGISHLYASPIALAVPGSTHGYDVVDPTRINPELGGEEGFACLARALVERGMGVLLDIVPNHMAASSHNPFWNDMLEGGPRSSAARVFDVKWESGRLLLPTLGDPLKATLEAGGLSLHADYELGRINAAYADHVFPLRAQTVAELLRAAGLDTPADCFAMVEEAPGDAGRGAARAVLTGLGDGERRALDAALAQADLAAVLDAQHWRLAWWRTAAHDLNYRRFFNITDLAGVRVEDPEVFDLVHRLPLDLVRRGLVHGLRIDHIDGLVDPAFYCDRLRAAVGPDVPILVEKILEPGETLRSWPIEGSTGYERLNDINALCVDADGYARFEEALRARHLLVGSLPERLVSAKRQVLEASLKAEVDILAALAREGLDAAMAAGDLTDTAIRDGVVALLAHCPVYRSYATRAGHEAEDIAIWTTIRARVGDYENPLTGAAAALLLDRVENPQRASDHEFRARFQQLSGPAMAKGFEDTELYRVPVLLCANEVGGSLDHPFRTIDEMHARAAARAEAAARDLIPLATHDTKRGPATRSRLAALSFRPERWLGFVDEAQALAAPLLRARDGMAMPDPLDMHLILQTLVSAWPISAERMQTYLTKALREAKRHSNWEAPNAVYEEAGLAFARALVEAPEAANFRARLEDLVADIAPAARVVGLTQLILQHTLPGTPDIYQGTEFPDFSLVDPDNRRPVDWEARTRALAGQGPAAAAAAEYFRLTRHLLALRRRNPALTVGDYRPLDIAPSPAGWFGFERRSGAHGVRIMVPTRVPGGDEVPAGLVEHLPAGWRLPVGPAIGPDWPFLLAETGSAG
ncbi:malto-oligosyltrehalose synthase [Ancylobacter dichloromethanicus]|uniref:Malto-oligosyltrehalose synthase n=1 Tax=Ancylobacter dichloromethanicus TaxID=518825 RepID=A0A9W6MZV3_9HYPH|nr:malto-oligosyltrehalose synthase [Ancylobacter dichloromethanicus]MBS7555137.1 malto-oligosyltrehalose synthase [Ancylobacter dichloromethanicus]GLK72508.1 malto-oligosyltrehalose synthase [Ancylobacter dichloromethanicus]